MFLFQFEHFTNGVEILELKSDRKNLGFPKSKDSHKLLELRPFLEGQTQESKIFRPIERLAFATIIVFLIYLGLGVKFSKWDSKMCWVQL